MNEPSAIGTRRSPLIVIEDTREPAREEHPWQWPARWPNADGRPLVVVRRALAEGDFGVLPLGTDPEDAAPVAALPVVVERKALPDLVACCTHERPRFERCLARLAELEAAVVVIEATEADVIAHCYRSRVSPSSVLASARAFAVDYRVPFWWAGWPDRARDVALWFLARAARKARARARDAA